MKKCVSLKNLFENGIPCLEFGGTIKFHKESEADYDLVNDIQEVILRDNEELDFGEWCCDETDGKFIVGTAESGRKVYFSKEEYDLAVSEKQTIELGKEYYFAGYKWIPVIKKNAHEIVIQSLGVTAGEWPGYKLPQFGNGNDYSKDIFEKDISEYDEKMQNLYKSIKMVEAKDGSGLYLFSYRVVEKITILLSSLVKAASNRSNGYFGCAWLGDVAWNGLSAIYVEENGDILLGTGQNDLFVVAPAFNLDLSKVEVCGDEIIIKNLAVSEKQTIELGKEYYFAGYKWIPVKKNANKVVIQSLGVTAGSWPGYKMLKFGGKIHGLYTSDIDGQNISAYDDKMQELYDIIKEVEDTSASYGRGLYLISKEKASFTKFGESALKEAANCARSFGASSNYAWLGTVCDRFSVWVINSNGYVYGSFSQYDDYVVAPAFNLDLSKVEVCGDEIIIKDDKPQPQTYGIMLIEKPEVEGLTKSEVMQMYDQMDADEAYPLEISGCETSAMGFITKDAAKILDYDYEESGLKDFVATILNDMNNESIDGIYKFCGIKIRLFR